MPGISQRVMRIRERATRWRPRGRLALALVAPAIVVAALAVPATMASAAVPGPPSGWSTIFSDDFTGGVRIRHRLPVDVRHRGRLNLRHR